MAIKVGMVSLGCSKNQVDAEIILAKLRERGYQIHTDSGTCDVVIVNTCGFIESAKQESIENILEFCTLKKEGRIKVIVVTGCLAERYQQEMAKEIPEADVILGIGSNDEICDAIEKALNGEKVYSFGPKENLPLEGERIISNLPFFAYLKIAEGCDNRCTYCAIPMIRGRYRSREMDNIVAEAQHLADHGVTEINVIAQDTTRYGMDLYGKPMLAELLRRLAKIENLHWIRVLYTYPDYINDELLEVIASEEKIVKYLDIPLQHCNGKVLREMNRRGDRASLTALIGRIREKVPGIIIRTTMIAGFPGETEEEFTELCEFVQEMKFERLGCFPYSAEENTPAGEREDQVDPEVRYRRAELIMEIQMEIMAQQNEQLVDTDVEVVVEGYDRYASSYFGRTAADAPDIDGKIFFMCGHKLAIGQYLPVHVDDVLDYDLIGSAE
ncbi:MAG: 30S ribosomal protein S12 methylthiotransferase RimO [Oscillospiraceae bacterium]|nr:30S ribosomal protein S12 methylthiotransferase RimO [Oscillospiraceae bacterium]MBR6607931.1 30S ribosomal protein S12 methylthiotransferase RimO [Oscillospiraceae bacterium]